MGGTPLLPTLNADYKKAYIVSLSYVFKLGSQVHTVSVYMYWHIWHSVMSEWVVYKST